MSQKSSAQFDYDLRGRGISSRQRKHRSTVTSTASAISATDRPVVAVNWTLPPRPTSAGARDR